VSYSDFLKHPLWQRKRLEILQAHKFKCDKCGDKDTTLHVHHGYYERGLKPWEYPTDTLHVLCEICHAEVTATRLEFDRYLAANSHVLDFCVAYVYYMRHFEEAGLQVPQQYMRYIADIEGMSWGDDAQERTFQEFKRHVKDGFFDIDAYDHTIAKPQEKSGD
jgi:hypothetical protein